MTQSSFSIAARQQLSASPQLQQAMRLLQMSALEFQEEFQQELASNPFLEEGEPGEQGAEVVAAEQANDNAALRQDGESGEGIAQFEAESDRYTVDGVEVSSLQAADWNELPAPGFETLSRGVSGDPEADPCNWISAETTLREHLHAQVCGIQLDERQRFAAVLVIETLDDHGYLRDDVADTALALELEQPLSEAEIAEGIRIVQQFDPAGVGARDLPECLMLQLRATAVGTPGRSLAMKLTGHLELLAKRDHRELQRRLDCSEPAIHEAHALIRTLEPHPGANFAAARVDYVVPDVIVVRQKGKLNAVINPAVMPKARLNSGCIDLLRMSRDGKYPAMQQQLQEARWLLRNIEQRYVTIKQVAEAIVARQRAFFEYGEIALKPLLLREIADELGLHESTLSRATSKKYMATPRGTFEFKHFFSRKLSTDTGGSCSATAVRAAIKEMIEGENRDAPLSDVSLAKMLTENGICVARRTVTKYRNQLKLPPVEMRCQP
ncbi:RNA polymerase factor sigma-54 [Nevskia ramosa]|uniref:RNA polymerase factor sigma-54 n=1 Tax=Nevskia ramosa TaxID=64002 RepID=UPI0003B701C3|nr:RNA polymerase factor sigma-54 [Nevskia ramosa]